MLFAAGGAAARPAGILVDTHIHLFDPARFPYHPNATYQPPAEPLEEYIRFAVPAGIDHAVIVHPEPYQDDHRYLEYCFAHEPSPGFFKGTCLFDPVAPDTPGRMQALARKHPNRIVALRIHEMAKPGDAPASSGAIKNRDLRSPAMKAVWSKARELGMAIQMHFLPHYAPRIGELAAQFEDVPVVLDHLARSGQGSAADVAEVLKLARYPLVYMKYSGVNYSSKQKYPFADVQPLIRRIYDAFGPRRIVWGGLGMNPKQFGEQSQLLDQMFAFATEAERARIRGLNAMELYRFQ